MLAQVGQHVITLDTVLSHDLSTQVAEGVQQVVLAQVELFVCGWRAGVLALLVVRVDHLAAGLGVLPFHHENGPVRRHVQFLHDGDEVVDGDLVAVLPTIDVHLLALVHDLLAKLVVPAGQ